jgi:acetyl/propionyl-CoA carboxylase alpha subunit
MIAKITAWGPDRAAALSRMREALRDTVVLGIETNLAFHLRVLAEPDFLAGDFSTRYIERHPDLVAAHEPTDADARAIAAAAAVRAATSLSRGGATEASTSDVSSTSSTSSWRRAARWRS